MQTCCVRLAPRFRPGSQITIILVLLMTVLAVVAVLTFQAHYATEGRRALAEEVLRDYAALVADEALRRVTLEVGVYGFRQGVQLLPSLIDEDEPAPPSAERVAAARAKERSAELMARTFVADPGRLHTSVARPGVDAWLAEELGRVTLDKELGFAVLRRSGSPIPSSGAAGSPSAGGPQTTSPRSSGSPEAPRAHSGGEAVTIVVGALESKAGRHDVLMGFEVDNDAMASWCRQALDRSLLLPPSLADGELDNGSLYVRALDRRTGELCTIGERDSAAFIVERGFPDDYAPALQGMTVEAGIRPQAASLLLIGGLPPSNRPILLWLLAVIAGLLLAAAALLRRQRALARMRSDFVSRVSHELRTPLAQLRLFTETLLLGRTRNEDERRRSLEIMDREARRLSALVENVLQYSRSERGGISLSPRTIELEAWLTAMSEELAALAQASESTVRCDVEGRIEIVVDEDALRQIVLNLVDNALKYGPDAQEVRLGALVDDDEIVLWVDDQGPGIARHERRRVWEAFHRAERAAAPTGTGIGLAVVRELVQAHGGRCRIERGRDGGARVEARFPATLLRSDEATR